MIERDLHGFEFIVLVFLFAEHLLGIYLLADRCCQYLRQFLFDLLRQAFLIDLIQLFELQIAALNHLTDLLSLFNFAI